MRTNLPRYGILLLNLLLIGVIQWGVYQVFIVKRPPTVEVHKLDLPGIAAIWRQQVAIDDPKKLTQPIRDAFGAAVAVEDLIPTEVEPADEGGEDEYQGPLQFIGIAYAPPGGRHIIWFEHGGVRASYVVGDELPDGKILHSVERLEDGKYIVRFQVKGAEKIEKQTYEVESL